MVLYQQFCVYGVRERERQTEKKQNSSDNKFMSPRRLAINKRYFQKWYRSLHSKLFLISCTPIERAEYLSLLHGTVISTTVGAENWCVKAVQTVERSKFLKVKVFFNSKTQLQSVWKRLYELFRCVRMVRGHKPTTPPLKSQLKFNIYC